MVGVLLTLASCIGDTRLLTILAYIKDYNPQLLVIIIIIIKKSICIHIDIHVHTVIQILEESVYNTGNN